MKIRELAKEIVKAMDEFPYNEIPPLKPKQDAQLWKVSEVVYKYYPYPRDVSKEVLVSLEMYCNEVCVKDLVTLAAKLCVGLEAVHGAYKAASGNQHLGGYYKQKVTHLKQKELTDNLVSDLRVLGDKFDFEVEPKEVMRMFKEKKEEAQKEHKRLHP